VSDTTSDLSPEADTPDKQQTPTTTGQEEDSAQPPSFPIVGIGASAGGLRSFELFFTHMPVDSGIAFVLVQHLDPTHKSILTDIISRYTSMPVFQVKDGIDVEPNSVYIIPPNRDMALLQKRLYLIEPAKQRGLRLPIDFFFRSLADELHEHAIVVVLSGTGTDGTLGLRAVKGSGGMVMVQEPTSAAYDGMPRSAIDTDLADYILPPEHMPTHLLKYIRHDFISGTRTSVPRITQPSESLHKIFILLRNQTGHDFSHYKISTIMRRIERRMAVNHITWIADYIRYLQQNSQEVTTLFKELLIGVTGFFRDPDAFDALRQQVIPKIFEQHEPHQSIRVWVAGCSTGEEAFSLAILFCEQMERLQQSYDIQIFATDIDNQAVEKARSGTYPDSIVADVPQQYLGYFQRLEDNTFQIIKQVRDIVIFAVQSVIKDPPFSNIDLISCRNLLIYFETGLQQRVLPLFHRSLNPNGFLLLGTAETVGAASHLFQTVDRKWQIFQRLPGTAKLPDGLEVSLPVLPDKQDTTRLAQPETGADLRNTAEQLLLARYAPACVLINEQGDILFIHGKTGKYWETATGKPDWNIFRIAREGLQFLLSVEIRKVLATRDDVLRSEARMQVNGDAQQVYVSVLSVPNTRLLLVVFEEKIPREPPQAPDLELDPGNERDAYILKLQQDLKSAEGSLYATNEELHATNEELRSSNEELQSANEELRSSNEELSTSKEELQSVNEELLTVNAELQNKIGELNQTNNYLRNLLASIEVSIIFLDQDLRVVWFTPNIEHVVHLLESDIGRHLGDLMPNIDYDRLIEDAHNVLNTLEVRTTEVRARKTGEYYWMRITPYRTIDNVIEGVVLSFSNITEQRKAQSELRKLTRAVEQSSSMVIITDIDGMIEYVNPQFTQVTGYDAHEIIGQPLRTLKFDQQALEKHEQAWQIINAGQQWHGEFCNRKKNGEQYWVAASRAPVRNAAGVITHVVEVEDDITQRKQQETELRTSEQFLISIYSGIETPIFVIDVADDGRYWYAGINPACQRIIGYTDAQLQGKYLQDLSGLLGHETVARLQRHFERVVQSGEAFEYEQRTATPAHKQPVWWLTRLEPLKDEQNRVYRIVATAHMINERKQARFFLQRQNVLCVSIGEWWPTVVADGSTMQQALHGLVHILVQAGGYTAAWVGVRPASGSAPETTPGAFVAAVAMANEPPDSNEQTWLAAEAGPTLAAQALDDGHDVLIVDVRSDAAAEPWRQSALDAGCPEMLALSVPAVEQPGPVQTMNGAIVVATDSMGEYDTMVLRSLTPHLTSIVRLLHHASGT
jgi:two-component system CheB/CheR fusion protein